VGRHNALNAIAACAAAYNAGLPGRVVEKALAVFSGAGRRMEYKGTFNGADVYDDYAHHPAELRALLSACKTMGYSRIICAFQPHTYTRTNALMHDFIRELLAADIAVLTDIYAARERNLIGISSCMIADRIPGSVYCPTLQDVTTYLRQIESGAKTPSLPVFVSLCRELKASPSYLLSEILPDPEIEEMDALLKLWRSATPKQLKLISSMIRSVLDNMED
ncbi:MAG: hypothetical protein IKD11_04735, partial [Oscillospiraceae bacterium]|nr:hypothetical protein [Oscillospiraceae bacterium]